MIGFLFVYVSGILSQAIYSLIHLPDIVSGKIEKGNPTTLPVYMLLDEFPNVGEIPDFNRKLTTVRSRLLSAFGVERNATEKADKNGVRQQFYSFAL